MNDYLYIFGGQDLKEGAFNTLWRLDLKKTLINSSGKWEQINCRNTPKPISHHNGFIHEDKLYIYGGVHGMDSNGSLLQLDLKNWNWTKIDFD